MISAFVSALILLRSTPLSALSVMSVVVPSAQKVIVPAFASTALMVPFFASAAKTTETRETTSTATARTAATFFIILPSSFGFELIKTDEALQYHKFKKYSIKILND